MSFDYEKSIWGRGTATLSPADPTSIRLKFSLEAVSGLKEGAKVLELGSGAGQFIRSIKKQRPDLHCFGSDISNNAIESARNLKDGVEYFLQEPKKLPFADEFFDSVLIYDVLEHVDDPFAIMREVNRVLRNGGSFYAFVPCEGDRLSVWKLLSIFGINGLTKKFAGHINYFSKKQLADIVIRAGFTIEKIKYSELLLGQLISVAAFIAMNFTTRKKGNEQINNETYFGGQKNSRWFVLLKNIINTLIYFESILFSRVPSPNVHILAKKSGK